MKPKKIPMRMCVGCRESKPKRELIRVVRAPDGTVSMDPGGKKPGRGAYVCRQESCLMRAIRQKQLERQLEVQLTDDVAEALRQELAQLSQSQTEAEEIRGGGCAVLLLDSGASKATQDKYRGVCDNAGVQMALLPRGLLQDATGRSGVAMAVAPGGLAEQIRQNLPVEGKEEHGQQMKSENHGGGASVE